MASDNLQAVFSKNRAEELGNDVWEHFVVPPFYDRLDLYTARKPLLIIGGRGCGKTMLLRYLSHETAFSRLRPSVPDEVGHHIGLYWRADTHFVNMMAGRDIPDETWHSAFVHTAALVLGMEVLASLRSISRSKSELLVEDDLRSLKFQRLQAFDMSFPSDFMSLEDDLQTRLWALQAWINDVKKAEEPRFLPGEKFVLALLQEIKPQLPRLKEANYFVYLDEYENLRPYQQRIVNTWLKHSTTPLIFNLAMKRNAFEIQATIGPESLSNIHDYRSHDLEYELEADFSTFAAEILFLQLSLAKQSVPIEPAVLRDPVRLRERREPKYIERVRTAAKKLLPGLTQKEMAEGVFADDALSAKLKERIRQALVQRESAVAANAFFRPALPEATIVTPALLFRQSLRPEEIKEELDSLEKGNSNSFTGTRDWIHNNFIGAYLQLYEPHSRACPFYAGFQSYCQLAHGNLRHFLELCHKSLSRMEEWTIDSSVPPQMQAEAAREASTAFLREVRSFGPRGLQLHAFVLRLGSLFAIAHQRPTQSEPEQTHFSIGEGNQLLTPDDFAFLREATKWSVLYEEPETKKKDSGVEPEDVEYVLAPIYAPYFHISYRKRRKIKLKTDECIVLIRGSYDQVKELLRHYSTSWEVQPSELTPTLFSHLG
jgi:hypothetical protein